MDKDELIQIMVPRFSVPVQVEVTAKTNPVKNKITEATIQTSENEIFFDLSIDMS